MAVVTTTWPMTTGAVVATTAVHLAAIFVVVFGSGMVIREPPPILVAFSGEESFQLLGTAVFEIASPAAFSNGAFLPSTGSGCGGKPTDAVPVAIISPVLLSRQPFRRAPRVCVLVHIDGTVGSARVLQSSGDAGADRAIEAGARRLAFRPATRSGLPVAATVTLDVIGNGR